MSRESLNFKMLIAFFLPLIFMTEMHQISSSLVHALLARLTDPTTSLAAFSIAYAFNTTISTVIQVAIPAGISFFTDRTAFWKLFRFFACVGILLFIAVEAIALTPLGDVFFGQWMGASDAVVKQARLTSAILGISSVINFFRNLCYALAMIHHRTMLITNATAIRLTALGISLFILPFWLDGAVIGGAALICGMTVEMIYIVIVSLPLLASLEKKVNKPPSYVKIWRFSWPLMITQSSERGMPLAINFFLGQLSNPDLALAGFGVVNGLINVFLSPLRNLVYAAQTFFRSLEALKVLFQFALTAVLFFVVVIFVLFFSPLQGYIVDNLMGLNLELNRYVTPGLKLTFLLAIFWGASAFLRGALSAIRRTGDIAFTVPIRFFMVVMVCSAAIFFPNMNGTIVGVLALSSAFASESLFLSQRLRRHYKVSTHLFDQLGE